MREVSRGLVLDSVLSAQAIIDGRRARLPDPVTTVASAVIEDDDALPEARISSLRTCLEDFTSTCRLSDSTTRPYSVSLAPFAAHAS